MAAGGSKKKSENGLIKSKERVRKYGEVFTPTWVVRDMCDMLAEINPAEDVFRIDSTFLEPSCGTGNFLVEIFARKLKNCKSAQDGLSALSSIYGIDIMEDNVAKARERLAVMYEERFGKSDSVTLILDRNILCGNFLTGRTVDGEPIWFLEDKSDHKSFVL